MVQGLNYSILTNLYSIPHFIPCIKYCGLAYNLVKRILAFQKQLAASSTKELAQTLRNYL